jgi:hypothetical protein
VAGAVLLALEPAAAQDVPALARALGLDRPGATLTAPSFALPDLDGRSVRLDDLRGRSVMLYFWTTY